MPIDLQIHDGDDMQLCVWRASESSAYYEMKLSIRQAEAHIIGGLSTRKRHEWLASRYVLHLMSGRTERGDFVKDIHGKPHLKDSDFHISISHSGDRVAVIAAPSVVGIDIQTYVSKISRIQHKFVSDEEAAMISGVHLLRGLHIIWGAKESLYKAYGKRALDFIQHLFITDLDVSLDHGHCIGEVKKEDIHMKFRISYHSFTEYMLVYATEIG